MESTEPPSNALYLGILLILLLCSMFFSASETSVISSSRLRIRYLKEKKNRAAERIQKVLQKKEFFLTAILIGNNIVNIGASALITAVSIKIFGHAGVGIATAAATVIILIFGEILPKSVALLRPENTAMRLSLPITLFLFAMSPVILVSSFFARTISALSGSAKKKARVSVTAEDIKGLIEVGEEEGLIETKKRDMMHKILKYTDLTARDIMTPRPDIVTVGIDMPRKEILALSHSSRFSRFPVYGSDIDDIKGILYIKDFLFSSDIGDEEFSVKELLRPALFIFESQKMSVLQQKLRDANQKIAVIIDEYGGTAGIVTTEDLVEKIFGGIRDEYDKKDASPGGETLTARLRGNTALVRGSERLDDINELLGIHLSSDFYDTIGGYIMENSLDMPEPRTAISDQGFTFTVTAVKGNRIDEIRIDRTGGDE
jgi:putative hemolysin